MKTKTSLIILILLIVVLFLVIGWMGWKGFQLQKGEILVVTDKKEYVAGEVLKVKIKNNFWQDICFSNCYPYYLERKNKDWETYKYEECYNFNGNGHCIDAQEEKAFELMLPQVSEATHRLAIPVCIGCKDEVEFQEDKRFYSNEFLIK